MLLVAFLITCELNYTLLCMQLQNENNSIFCVILRIVTNFVISSKFYVPTVSITIFECVYSFKERHLHYSNTLCKRQNISKNRFSSLSLYLICETFHSTLSCNLKLPYSHSFDLFFNLRDSMCTNFFFLYYRS